MGMGLARVAHQLPRRCRRGGLGVFIRLFKSILLARGKVVELVCAETCLDSEAGQEENHTYLLAWRHFQR